MFDFLEVIVKVPKNFKCGQKHNTPAATKLFSVNKNLPLLNQNQTDLLHCLVLKLLFTSNRAQSDIQVTVEFLCSRVKEHTEQDYKKMGQVIKYVTETIRVPLILGLDDSKTLIWNVDVSYSVHPDMKSHTVASLFLIHGTLLLNLCKLKLLMKSSTDV